MKKLALLLLIGCVVGCISTSKEGTQSLVSTTEGEDARSIGPEYRLSDVVGAFIEYRTLINTKVDLENVTDSPVCKGRLGCESQS